MGGFGIRGDDGGGSGDGNAAFAFAAIAFSLASLLAFSALSIRAFAWSRILCFAAAASSFGTGASWAPFSGFSKTNASASIFVMGAMRLFLMRPKASGSGRVAMSGEPSPRAYWIPSIPGKPPVLPVKEQKRYVKAQRNDTVIDEVTF